MQTFLPYPGFAESARALDRQRLGKQRVEARQILETLQGISSGWANHPAVRMWRGHEGSLAAYMKAMIDEWTARGYRNEKQVVRIEGDLATVILSPSAFSPKWGKIVICGLDAPPWLGNADFHASHRSNLLRKDSGWYGRFGWAEPPTLPYVWPKP
jgi:hypothetical protein